MALHNFLCVRARLGIVLRRKRFTYPWFASAGDGKITAERFVFHYIIRSKLFPKSSDQKYQRYLYPIIGLVVGLGLCNLVDFLPACVPSKFNKRGEIIINYIKKV